jgi:hypothetical protein
VVSVQRTCCQSGDYTVTPVHRGFLVGRVLPDQGLGPWWMYVGIYSSMSDAIAHAIARANEAKTGAWYQLGPDEYQPIPLDGTPFVME